MDKLTFQHKTYKEIEKEASSLIAIQPIGSTEQHGSHLPVGTDSLIAEAISKGLKEIMRTANYPAVFLPLIPYGKSNEHNSFPGTVCMQVETLIRILSDIGASLQRSGFRKLVFLNGHGGNHEVLDFMCREIRIQTGIKTFVLHPFLKIMPENFDFGEYSESERKFGIHAGRMETSIILYIDPELVRKKEIKASIPEFLQQKEFINFSECVPFGWITEDVSENGVIGDPSQATQVEGEKLLTGIAQTLFKVMEEIRAM
ncbi:creatininase family protein [Sediminispirochaeta smaragdinae]|uniref:Creatininase n=1 Tax=Sediminispirochaeta smaragdinae (strain DSM 11293 / JCM 15392 / SEBR 4228) TaxID=573413 RepID=E1R2Q3_SEDSS|nr:creatininase family protein [Sediminispirochaeta smaragdinae]ADK80335.1 Creatininase [Sediminispirochaeta smaragdinae DSM 11293]